MTSWRMWSAISKTFKCRFYNYRNYKLDFDVEFFANSAFFYEKKSSILGLELPCLFKTTYIV